MRNGECGMGNAELKWKVVRDTTVSLTFRIPNSTFRILGNTKPVLSHRTGFVSGSWQRPTLPRPRDRSTIGADRLNDRVRDGNGCGPVALVASTDAGVRCWVSGVRFPWHLTPDTWHLAFKTQRGVCGAQVHSPRPRRDQASRAISTARLKRSRALHLPP